MGLTVITGPKGEVVATMQGHSGQLGMEAGLLTGPGQKIHELTLPDEVAASEDAEALHKQVIAHLPSS